MWALRVPHLSGGRKRGDGGATNWAVFVVDSQPPHDTGLAEVMADRSVAISSLQAPATGIIALSIIANASYYSIISHHSMIVTIFFVDRWISSSSSPGPRLTGCLAGSPSLLRVLVFTAANSVGAGLATTIF